MARWLRSAKSWRMTAFGRPSESRTSISTCGSLAPCRRVVPVAKSRSTSANRSSSHCDMDSWPELGPKAKLTLEAPPRKRSLPEKASSPLSRAAMAERTQHALVADGLAPLARSTKVAAPVAPSSSGRCFAAPSFFFFLPPAGAAGPPSPTAELLRRSGAASLALFSTLPSSLARQPGTRCTSNRTSSSRSSS
eukprot:scaffold81970_cov22-Tisochrysis_lutea.AAC.5